jgi:MFS superfamily sulfate permease-like transporter
VMVIDGRDDLSDLQAWKMPTRDWSMMVATTVLTLALGIDLGIYCGIAIPIADLVLRLSYPDIKLLGE